MTINTAERQQSTSDILFSHIGRLVKNSVSDSDTYWEHRGQGATPPDAIRETAMAVASDKNAELSEADRSLLTVVGNLGQFVQAQDRHDGIYSHFKDKYIPESEYKEVRQLKDEYLIPFNHLLKDYVNTHPNDGIHATSTALANVYDKVFARFDCLDSTNERAPYDISSGYVFDKIKTALDGMRHEVAAEMILDAAGYTYDYNVTTQEDARGSDLFVYLESGWEGIDVKASQSGVQRSQGQGHASRAVSTGLGWGDFTGLNGTGKETLSIPFATAELKAPYFIDSIYEMTARVEAEAQARARRTGHHTLKRMR